MSETAIKRDQHFIKTQNCVGSTLVFLATVIGMLLSDPEEGVDRLELIEHIGDAGQLLSDIFHQQSACRKSFITPKLDKSLKPILKKIVCDVWLYNNNFGDLIKDARALEKVSSTIKASVKPQFKNSSKLSQQGNQKGSFSKTQQMGNYQRVNWKPQYNMKSRPYVKNSNRPLQNQNQKRSHRQANTQLWARKQ